MEKFQIIEHITTSFKLGHQSLRWGHQPISGVYAWTHVILVDRGKGFLAPRPDPEAHHPIHYLSRFPPLRFSQFLGFSRRLTAPTAAASARSWTGCPGAAGNRSDDATTVIRLKRIYNFWCSMLVYVPFALCFVTLRGVFMHFPELTY
jgi:hypothetical protein